MARDAKVQSYIDSAAARIAQPLSTEEKAARVAHLTTRIAAYENQWKKVGAELVQARTAKTQDAIKNAEDLLERNFQERKEMVLELRSLGETMSDRTD